MKEENISIRLKFLISELGINNTEFADKCGISRATLSQLLTGRNKKISDVIISQIHTAYPSLSIMWLLFSEGDMWLDGPGTTSIDSTNGNGENPEEKSGNSEKVTDLKDSCSGSDYYLGKIPAENPGIPGDCRDVQKNLKENGLNLDQNLIQHTIREAINNCLKSAEFINEIENLRKNSRKVVQITVYYDDSTFETFHS